MNLSRTKLIRALPWIWLIAWGIACALAPPSEFNLSRSLHFPFDAFGRNLFYLTAFAAKGSLVFAFATLFLTGAAALVIAGTVSVAPHGLRSAFERVLDFFIAFPSLLIALAGQAVLGTGSSTLILSLGFGLLPATIRFLSLRGREVSTDEYVTAATALGSGRSGILIRHITPALLDHLRIKLPYLFSQAIAMEATLSFLGLGASPGSVTWGALLSQAKDYLIEAPYISWMVGLPLLLTLVSFMTLEERFRDRKTSV